MRESTSLYTPRHKGPAGSQGTNAVKEDDTPRGWVGEWRLTLALRLDKLLNILELVMHVSSINT